MKKVFSAISAILMVLNVSYAQEQYALKIETDKKILYMDQLGLPESVSVLYALTILPELLSRSDDVILKNYDVKIDGFSLGSNCKETLSQIRVGQVEKIEVSNSPIDSYKNNGQGGSINVILRRLDEGFSGEASLATYSILDIKPMVLLGYKKNGFTLRGIAEFEHYNSHSGATSSKYVPINQSEPYSQTDSIGKKFTGETVRILMEYRPSDRDEFKLRVAENYSWKDRDLTINVMKPESTTTTNKKFSDRVFCLDANTKFTHTFSGGSKFILEGTYSHSPSYAQSMISNFKDVSSDDLNSSISGKVEYEQLLKSKHEGNFTKLNFGANINYTTHESYDQLMYESGPDTEFEGIINSVVHGSFISPYVKYDAKLGKWRLKAEVEYQSFSYNVRGLSNEKFTQVRGDVTGKAMAGWQINSNNHLQLIIDRKLERPAGELLYPFLTFDPDDDRFELGNPDLTPVTINEVSLNYITNFNKGPHSFLFSGEVNYSIVENMLTPVQKTYEDIIYYSFENSGVNHILSCKAMAEYKVGVFSLVFTGNLFNNRELMKDKTDHYTYYNLSLFPYFNFRYGWTASAKCTYLSRITTSTSNIGSATTLILSAGKSWGKFALHVMGNIPLSGMSTDISFDGKYSSEKTYYFVQPYAGFMVNYKF